jgi:hypothetical protein
MNDRAPRSSVRGEGVPLLAAARRTRRNQSAASTPRLSSAARQ